MATIAAATKLQRTDRRRSRNAGNDRGRHTSPNGGVLLEQILENMNATPREEVLRRIASLSDAEQDKVLDLRRRITEGTYEVVYRLDKVVDRVLEAITT
jgi:anti-sigma28 factor (negative regulator of flagellin synthesis)